MIEHPYVEQFEKVPIEVRVRHDLSRETLVSLISRWAEAGVPSPSVEALAELGHCAQWLSQAFGLDAEMLVGRLADTILRSLRDDGGVQW